MVAQYVVGQVLPNGATVTKDAFTTDSDGTTHETMEATYASGAVDHTIITTPGPGTPEANYATLRQKAQAALVNNAAYLALPTPTTAQNAAQIGVLTREASAIIRLLLNQLDTTTGT